MIERIKDSLDMTIGALAAWLLFVYLILRLHWRLRQYNQAVLKAIRDGCDPPAL